jgi:hypothetical protein
MARSRRLANVPPSQAASTAPYLGVAEDGRRFLRNDRRAEPGHRGTPGLTFLGRPAPELLERPKVDREGCRAVALHAVHQEGLDMVPLHAQYLGWQAVGL